VDLGGMCYFWGLTIDTVTTIILIIAIGLAIDYAAHIGHNFMTNTGTRKGKEVSLIHSLITKLSFLSTKPVLLQTNIYMSVLYTEDRNMSQRLLNPPSLT